MSGEEGLVFAVVVRCIGVVVGVQNFRFSTTSAGLAALATNAQKRRTRRRRDAEEALLKE
jgi:hypothetical protein